MMGWPVDPSPFRVDPNPCKARGPQGFPPFLYVSESTNKKNRQTNIIPASANIVLGLPLVNVDSGNVSHKEINSDNS